QNGQITKFSSCGPTFDGRIKPDVVAPGLNINAAYNSFYGDFAGIKKSITHQFQHNGKDYYYLAESGTSMASPVVAGVIALWLQAKPDLTPAEAMEVIRETSTHPDNTLEYPNNTYGYGQIDAYRGLLYVLDLPSRIPDLSQNQPQGVTFRVVNRHLYADFGDECPKQIVFNVYSLNGSLVRTQSGRSDIDLSMLKDGVYAVQLLTDKRSTTGSTLIRLP
ncbi:MAG: S8 family serine peptidase, partial [Bacteroidales bacterium]|nr:S8 family serine peptidase [Bacteroidales bacterium]